MSPNLESYGPKINLNNHPESVADSIDKRASLRPYVKRHVSAPYKPFKALPCKSPTSAWPRSTVSDTAETISSVQATASSYVVSAKLDSIPVNDSNVTVTVKDILCIPVDDISSEENFTNGQNVPIVQEEAERNDEILGGGGSSLQCNEGGSTIDFCIERSPYHKKLRKTRRMSVSVRTEIHTVPDVEEIVTDVDNEEPDVEEIVTDVDIEEPDVEEIVTDVDTEEPEVEEILPRSNVEKIASIIDTETEDEEILTRSEVEEIVANVMTTPEVVVEDILNVESQPEVEEVMTTSEQLKSEVEEIMSLPGNISAINLIGKCVHDDKSRKIDLTEITDEVHEIKEIPLFNDVLFAHSSSAEQVNVSSLSNQSENLSPERITKTKQVLDLKSIPSSPQVVLEPTVLPGVMNIDTGYDTHMTIETELNFNSTSTINDEQLDQSETENQLTTREEISTETILEKGVADETQSSYTTYSNTINNSIPLKSELDLVNSSRDQAGKSLINKNKKVNLFNTPDKENIKTYILPSEKEYKCSVPSTLKYCNKRECAHSNSSCFAVKLEQLKEKYNISPLKVLLTDNVFHDGKVMNNKKRKIGGKTIDSPNRKKVKTTNDESTNNKIVNIDVHESCQSFEEKVAQKIAERKKKQNISVGNVLCESVNPITIDNKMHSIEKPPVSSPVKADNVLTGINNSVFQNISDNVISINNSNSNKTSIKVDDVVSICHIKNNVPSKQNVKEAVNLVEINTTRKKSNNMPLNLPPGDDFSSDLDKTRENILSQLKRPKSGSAKRKFASPRKSLSPTKAKEYSERTFPDKTFVTPIGVISTDLTLTNDSHSTEKRSTSEDILSIPLHPSLRLKIKSMTCQCNIADCPHMNTPSPSKSYSFDLTACNQSHMETPGIIPVHSSTLRTPVKVIDTMSSFQSTSSPRRRRSSINFRPSLMPKASPLSAKSLLGRSISSTQTSPEFKFKFKRAMKSEFDLIELSDSDTTLVSSQYSSDNELPTVVHISSDDEEDEASVNGFITKVKQDETLFVPSESITETFVSTGVGNLNDIMKSELDNTCYNDDISSSTAATIERRRRKTSSKKRIETFITTTKIKTPAVVTPSFVKVSHQDPIDQSCMHTIKSVTYRQMKKLAERFQLKSVKVKLMKLDSRVVEQVIQLCEIKENNWSDKVMLLKAGLDSYDVDRLGLKMRRDLEKGNYGLRKFLKRRDVFQSLLEVPKKQRKRHSHELEFLKSQKKKLREIMKAKQETERKKSDLESIRRSLLQINGKFLSQTRFWNYLKQGSCPEKAIQI